MARLELEIGTDVLLLETGDALLLEILEHDGLASGSGIGISTAQAILDILAEAIGEGLGTALAEGTIWFCKSITVEPSRLEIIQLKPDSLEVTRLNSSRLEVVGLEPSRLEIIRLKRLPLYRDTRRS